MIIGALEKWVVLLAASRQRMLGAAADFPGGGLRTPEDLPFIFDLMEKEDLDSKKAILRQIKKCRETMQGNPSLPQLAFALGETVFLAGIRWRLFEMEDADFFRYAVPAAFFARNFFSSWDEFFKAYLQGADEHFNKKQLSQLKAATFSILGEHSFLTQCPWESFPKTRSSMDSILFRLRQQCSSCLQFFHVNQFGKVTECPHCLEMCLTPYPETLAPDVLDSIRHKIPGMSGMNSQELAETGTLKYFAENTQARCLDCGENLDLSPLQKSPAPTHLSCSLCQQTFTVRALGEETRQNMRGLQWVVGESLGSELKPKVLELEKIHILCSFCETPHKLSTMSPMVNCECCKAVERIPDNVWEQIHPQPPIRGVYLIGLC